MNKTILQGRLVRDPEVKGTDKNGMPIVRFTIATAGFKEDDSDFHNITAFGKTAEFINNFFKKGKPINVEGRNMSGSYEKDGNTIYTYEVVADRVSFTLSDNSGDSKHNTQTKTDVHQETKHKQQVVKNDIPWEMDI